MIISLNEQIRKDKELEYRRRRNERRDYNQRKRYDARSPNNSEQPNRRNYQSKRNHEQRNAHQQQKQCIKISNLHYEVTKEQLQVHIEKCQMIFSQCGKLKSCRIDWDKMGRSKETATIEYFHKEDEQRALKELKDQILEGQTIKLELANQPSAFINKKHQISKHYNSYRPNKQYRK